MFILTSHKLKKMGYSILELMIVVTIVAGLAAVAIPNYMRNVRKAQIIKVINFMESFKPQIIDYISSRGVCPTQVKIGTVVLTAGNSYSVPAGTFQGDPIVSIAYYGQYSGNVAGKLLCQISPRVNNSLGGGNLKLQVMDNSTTRLIETYCGFWSTAGSEMANSLPYMPQTCNRTDLSTL